MTDDELLAKRARIAAGIAWRAEGTEDQEPEVRRILRECAARIEHAAGMEAEARAMSAELTALRAFKEAALDVLPAALHGGAPWQRRAAALVDGTWDPVTGFEFGPPYDTGAKSGTRVPNRNPIYRQALPLAAGEAQAQHVAVDTILGEPPAGHRWESWEERRARLLGAGGGG